MREGKKKESNKPLTFQDMMETGLGALRLAPSVFYDMTLRELLAAMKGMADQEERAYRQQWTQARWMAATLLQPHTKQKIKPKDLMCFPWEQPKSKAEQEQHNLKELKALSKMFRNGTERPNS